MSELRPGHGGQSGLSDSTEEGLRAEIQALRRQLDKRNADEHAPHGHRSRRPSAGTLWTLGIIALVVLVAAFFGGYLPQSKRETALAKESVDDNAAMPVVNFVK